MGQGLYNHGGCVKIMEHVETPENWKSMNFGDKLIWLYEKQREIEERLEGSL